MPERRVQERRHVEGVRVRSVNGSIHARAVKVECEDRQQHNDEPDLREDEELKGRVSAVPAPPDPHEEENRNDDEVPQNRKEQEGEGQEEADEGDLQGKEEAEERLRAGLFVPMGSDRAGEGDQDEEAQDVRHLIDPAPTTNAGGKSVRT